MRQAPTGSYWYGSNKNTPKTLQFADLPQGKIKFSTENGKDTESLPHIKALRSVRKSPPQH